jgi:hypothetical protein
MKTYTKKELDKVLKLHDLWLNNKGGGIRADLSGADLSYTNLPGANLSGANLFDADLSGANLYGAKLSGANLSNANLSGANLSGANLFDADLSGAILSGANLFDADLPYFQIPQDGDLTVWKKFGGDCYGKLLVPEGARRTASLVGKKCRAEFVKVLEIYSLNDNTVEVANGWYNKDFIYKVGETIYPDSYDDDIRVECTNGIHFFLTKEEALSF